MSIKAETTFSLKDQLFNAQTVRQLAGHIAEVDRNFDENAFVRSALDGFPTRELKQRIAWLVDCLGEQLPSEFDAARDVLLRALPEPLDPTRTDDDFGQFIWVVPGEYAARHGCTRSHLPAALDFLREATKRFSSENAIRPFLSNFPTQTMAFMRACATDDNYHVRRLASEGTRPFLPWAPRVNLPADDVVGLLDVLHADPTRYVTRSVANALNDFSKLDADLVVATLQRWHAAGAQAPVELEWMTYHALRTLLKGDNAAALALTGYPIKPAFSVSGVDATPQVELGSPLVFRCTVVSKARQKLRIGLRVHFLKSNGRHAAKVFAVKDIAAGAGERIAIEKRVAFKPLTTRVLYPGEHFVELVVNGVKRGKRAFVLQA